MSELERIEMQATREAVVLGGGRAELIGGAVCVSHPLVPIMELNRALPVGDVVDVDAIASWFGGRHSIGVGLERSELAHELEERGYEPARTWMKFERDATPAPSVGTDLRVEETLDAGLFGDLAAQGFGMPTEAAAAIALIVGAPGWNCFVAWAGDEPAASGVLYADGTSAWIGVGSTRSDFRRRGAQNALLAARIDAARALGATLLTTETGELLPDLPASSYRSILRAGFREAYLRPNWRSPE